MLSLPLLQDPAGLPGSASAVKAQALAKSDYVSIPVDGFDATVIRSSAIGRFFTLRWRHQGKYKYKSLRTRNISKAMYSAKRMMTLINRGISPDTDTRFDALFEEYLKTRTCGQARLRQIENFYYKHLRPYWAEFNVQTISSSDWDSYKAQRLRSIRQSGVSIRWTTLEHETVVFRAFIRFCHRRNIISSVPQFDSFSRNDGSLTNVKQRGAAYSPDEIRTVFSILKERSDSHSDFAMQSYYAKQLYAYAVTLFFSASRAGEIKQLRVNDIEFLDDCAVISIRPETSKVRAFRKTAIPLDAAVILRDFIAWSDTKRDCDNGLIFYSYNDSSKVIEFNNKTFKRLMTEAGIYKNDAGTIRPLSSLRNSALTILSEEVSQPFLTSVAGTSSKMLRQHYHDRQASDLAGYTASVASKLLS